MAQCIVFAIPSKLSAVWFGEEEQGLAMALGWCSTYAGVAFGFFIPPLAVSTANNMAVGHWIGRVLRSI
jgi:hypothetical protein